MTSIKSVIVSVIVAATILGSGVLGPARPAMAAQDNYELFKAVQRQVLRYPFFSIFDRVETQIDNGVVTLTGKVTMPFKANDISRRVAKVPGVARVQNRIETLPVSRFDDELRVRLARAIYTHPNFVGQGARVNPPIHIIVEYGKVTLEGVVDSDVDRALAQAIATNFLSFEVKNELRTVSEARKELERL